MMRMLREILSLPWYIHVAVVTVGFVLAGLVLGITALSFIVEIDL